MKCTTKTYDLCGISRSVSVITTLIRTYIQLNVMFREGHFLTELLENVRPLVGWCEEVSLTMPEPSCCSSPEPCEPPSTAEGRLDRMLCMLLLSRNGTLLLVLGIEPPYNTRSQRGPHGEAPSHQSLGPPHSPTTTHLSTLLCFKHLQILTIMLRAS